MGGGVWKKPAVEDDGSALVAADDAVVGVGWVVAYCMG